MLSSILRAARQNTSLDPNAFAHLVDIEASRLQRLEENQDEPTTAELDRYAKILGLRVKDLLAGEAAKAPMTLLLRSTYQDSRPSFEELEYTGAHHSLGGFLQVVRDIAELEEKLDKAAPPPLRIPPQLRTLNLAHVEQAARWVREKLNLGRIEPVPSIRKLLSERLNVALLVTTPDHLDQSIDGATTHTPRPAILVNVIGGWWRTRMTLAHELAHLLYDDNANHAVLLSPHRTQKGQLPKRWRLFGDFDDIETRANAFAACFLAPEDGVRKLVQNTEPSSEAAIGLVGKHFGVGRTVAINRLHRVFNLSPEIRRRMDDQEGQPYNAQFTEDMFSDADIGLRHGVLIPLVAEALSAGRIGKTRAWQYLDKPLSEPIDALGPQLREPPLSPERMVENCAQRYLTTTFPERQLFVVGVSRDDATWCIQVGEGGIGEKRLAPAGQLRLGEKFEILAAKIVSSSPPHG